MQKDNGLNLRISKDYQFSLRSKTCAFHDEGVKTHTIYLNIVRNYSIL